MKTKHDNNMIYRIVLIYVENDIKHLGPIGLSVIYDETRYDNNVIDLLCVIYTKNKIELSWLIKLGVVYHEN